MVKRTSWNGVKTYTTKELIFMTGLSETTLKDLFRLHNGQIRFKPEIEPSHIKGKPRLFTESDVTRLNQYRMLREQVIKLNKEIQEILKG